MTVTDCNRLQQTAIDCNRLQQTIKYCNRLQTTAVDCNTPAVNCNRLQQTAVEYNRLQHTDTHKAHGTYEWNMSSATHECDIPHLGPLLSHATLTNEACHTHKWVMSAEECIMAYAHMNESYRASELIFFCDMTPSCICRFFFFLRHDSFLYLQANDECICLQIHEWVMAHTWMSHVALSNGSASPFYASEPCHTHERVMACRQMHHGTHMNASCRASKRHCSTTVLLSHVTHMNASCLQTNTSWHIHECSWVMSHS